MIHPYYTWGAMAATLAITIAEILIPLVTARAVDTATEQARPTALWSWITSSTGWTPLTAVIVVMVVIALLRYAFQFSRRYLAGQMSQWAQHELRIRVLGSLVRLGGKDQDNIRTGQVVSRSISDLNMVQGLLAMFPLAAGSVVKFAIILVVMFTLSWQMSLAAVIVTPILVIVGLWSKRSIFASTWTAQQQAANVATHVEQTVTGVRVVKGFAQEEREITTLDKLGRTLYALQMRAAHQQAKFLPTLAELPNLALVANVAIGGWLALNGHITIGIFLAFSTYLTTLTGICRMLSNMAISMQMALSSVSRVFDVVDLEADSDPACPSRIPDGPLGISFDNVSFSQPQTDVDTPTDIDSEPSDSNLANSSDASKPAGERILNHFSLDIAPGETTVLVGPPGAGKSMLVQLAEGFYPASEGSIRLTTRGAPPLHTTAPMKAPASMATIVTSALASARTNPPSADLDPTTSLSILRIFGNAIYGTRSPRSSMSPSCIRGLCVRTLRWRTRGQRMRTSSPQLRMPAPMTSSWSWRTATTRSLGNAA